MGDQLGRHDLVAGQVAGDGIPRAVAQDHLALEVLDVLLLERRRHVDDHGCEVVLLLDVADGPGVLGPPLVFGEVAVDHVAGPGHVARVLEERVALVRGPRPDVVAEAEVVDVAEELGLTVDLAAVVDGGLLVDPHAQVVLAGHAVPFGRDLDAAAVLGFVEDRDAVDADLDHVVDRGEPGREQGRDVGLGGRVLDDELGPARDLAGIGLECFGCVGHQHLLILP